MDRYNLMKLCLGLSLAACGGGAGPPPGAPPDPPVSASIVGYYGAENFTVSFDAVAGATSYVIYSKVGSDPTKSVYDDRTTTVGTSNVLVPNQGSPQTVVKIASVNAAGEGELSSPGVFVPEEL